MLKRHKYTITGLVQGVGFRPFIFNIAKQLGLTGNIRNTFDGVELEVQGEQDSLEKFKYSLSFELPQPAKIISFQIQIIDNLSGETNFIIEESSVEKSSSLVGKNSVFISPDMSTCPDCISELNEITNRRYCYPFTNCTICGPRYTIIHQIPYDRNRTTMACFNMCPDCKGEYSNPADRRFHAQPNACTVCGPRLWITDTEGHIITEGYEAICNIINYIYAGKIVAIKGIGGFHLVCDATNSFVINELRHRKHRLHKPFAVMVPNLAGAHKIAFISEVEAMEMSSSQAPIVIVQAIPGRLPENVAPDISSVGLMLPYTPLHHVLFKEISSRFKTKENSIALIMTSGNKHSQPIVSSNREALTTLAEIADFFLFHDRDILVPIDDSVIWVESNTTSKQSSKGNSIHMVRRARGYTPLPIIVKKLKPEGCCVLAVGAERNNTFCLTKGQNLFLSQYIGDVTTPETDYYFRQMVRHVTRLFEVTPDVVVCDLHPNYLSTEYALEFDVPLLRLQHHFAHGYSVLAEHDISDPTLVLALDGTGYALDNTVWGGELLYLHPTAVKGTYNFFGSRLGRLSLFPLPGGEIAIREPWRLVSGFFSLFEYNKFLDLLERLWGTIPGRLDMHAILYTIINSNNTIMTSSCGRLFDAVSALLGLGDYITYEGQAAIRLEYHQDITCVEGLPTSITQQNGLYELDTTTFFSEIVALLQQNVSTAIIARQFHIGLSEGLADLALAGAQQTGINTVALSGGVLQNKTITFLLSEALRRRGLIPIMPKNVPSGDGGISLGQAYWARMVID